MPFLRKNAILEKSWDFRNFYKFLENEIFSDVSLCETILHSRPERDAARRVRGSNRRRRRFGGILAIFAKIVSSWPSLNPKSAVASWIQAVPSRYAFGPQQPEAHIVWRILVSHLIQEKKNFILAPSLESWERRPKTKIIPSIAFRDCCALLLDLGGILGFFCVVTRVPGIR